MYGLTYFITPDHRVGLGGGGGGRREGGRERFGLYCLMTPGLSKDIQCHV